MSGGLIDPARLDAWIASARALLEATWEGSGAVAPLEEMGPGTGIGVVRRFLDELEDRLVDLGARLCDESGEVPTRLEEDAVANALVRVVAASLALAYSSPHEPDPTTLRPRGLPS